MFAYDAHKTGALNELKAQLYFMKSDYDVFIPTHNKTRADFIAVKGNEVLRIQVKTAQYNDVYIQSRLSIGDKRYTKEDCDVVVFVLEDRMWVATIEEVQGMTSVCLGKRDDNSYKSIKNYDPTKWEVL